MNLKPLMGHVKEVGPGTAIRAALVAGWFWLGPSNHMFGNYVYLLHYAFWFSTAMSLIGVFGLGIMAARVDSATASDIKLLRGLYVMSKSWVIKVFNGGVKIPSVLFVGVVMGDWSLLVPMFLSDAFSWTMVLIGVAAWDRIPEAVRNPTPEAKAETDAMVHGVSTGPIGLVVEDIKAEKAAEAALADAAVGKIVGE